MDQVYQNATLTVFAAGGDYADAGLAFQRDPRSTKPCKIKVTMTALENTFSSQLYVTMPVKDQNLVLFKRGWILQEEILSRRSLVFGDRQMSWGCPCCGSSEQNPNFPYQDKSVEELFEDGSVGENLLKLYLEYDNPEPYIDGHEGRRNNHLDCWYDMVKDYGRRELSNSKDVLKALRGLENAVAKKHHRTPYSGLWLEDLPIGLTWYISRPGPAGSPHRADTSFDMPKNIPTWSWASRWGQALIFLAHMAEANTEHPPDQGLQVIGLETSGGGCNRQILNVSGLLKQAEVYPLPGQEAWDLEFPKDGRPAYDDPTDTRGKFTTWPARWIGAVTDPLSSKLIGQIAYDADPEEVNLKSISCLLCLVQLKDAERITCLALVPTMQREDEYRRVGLVSIRDQRWFDVRSFVPIRAYRFSQAVRIV
jgi:hypothetical protein